MSILVVEDDDIQADLILPNLKRAFRQDTIDLIRTEYEFRDHLDKIRKNPPDVIVIDIMLRWTDPSEDMPPRPEEVRREGPNRAGFRCKKILAEEEGTKHIPVILYTVLADGDIEHELASGDVYLNKDDDFSPLIQLIREITMR